MNDAKLPSILSSPGVARAGAIALGLLCLAWMAPAGAWVIGFEDVVTGRVINEDVFTRFSLGDGVTAGFSATSRPGDSSDPDRDRRLDPRKKVVIFDTASPTGGDFDLAGPLPRVGTGEMVSPGKVAILMEDDDVPLDSGGCSPTFCVDPDDEGARPAGTFFIDFDDDVTFKGYTLLDNEAEEDGPSNPDNMVLLYDSTGAVIHTTFKPVTGDHKLDRVTFLAGTGVPGVRRSEFRMGGSGALDDFFGDFDRIKVPEPSSLVLLLCGLAGLGLWRRAR